jgi:imidazolonepropionase-like amidohydrolase
MKLAPLKRCFIKMDIVAKTLFTNANLVLDGFAELQKSFDVLVQGDRILSVSQTPMDHEDANVIDIRGRTLMPGLIDAHAHYNGIVAEPKKHLVSDLRNRYCGDQLSAL